MKRCFLAFALTFSCHMAAANVSLPKALPPDQEAAAIHLAEATARAIYLHDRAAAVATDAVRKLPQFKVDKRVTGWITEARQSEMMVTFLDASPAALYRIPVSMDGVAGPVTAMDIPAPLTAYETGAAAARAAALAAKFQPCSDAYNSVVLPGADINKWVVYLLPGTTKDDIIPFGGTYRMEVADSKLISQRGFTHTCITLKNDPAAVGLMITHLLDPIPTEAHVFWSIWARKSIYVLTPPFGTVWSIDSGKVKLVERYTSERK